MKVVNLDRKIHRPITVMTYGRSRVGKTRFASTWPRPVFLSDARERGWETIRYMNPENFYEPGRAPEVWAIEGTTDMLEALKKIDERRAKDRASILTIVVDSLTLYSDFYFTELQRNAMRDSSKRPDVRRLYGDLAQHIAWVQSKVHEMGTNVVWCCLEKSPNEDNPLGGPLLTGQTADKAPARCDYLFYQRAYRAKPTEDPRYEIRTRVWQSYKAGGRTGDLPLPDPLKPTYRTLAEALGIPSPLQAQQAPPRRAAARK